MTQGKQLDFSGQKIYCGIDVHKKAWKICIRNERMELKTFSQKPSAIELVNHLKKNYPMADYKAVYEAGFCGFGHQREFSKEKVNCIVIHPADVPTTDKEKQRKSDIVDCRKLSATLSDGSLKGIYIPSIEQQDDRGIIRTYQQFIKDQSRCKNRIKGFLNFQGVTIPEDEETKYWSKNFILHLKELSLTPSARISLDLSLQNYEQTRKMVLAATRHVRKLSGQLRYENQIKLLRSIPGIGQITALLYATEIGDINRFKKFDQLCDYIGLVPRISGSGEHETIMGLTHRGNHALRESLIEASWVAVRLDPAMTMAFTDYCKRMKKNKAIIKIARKLLSRIRFVMKSQEKYVSGKVE